MNLPPKADPIDAATLMLAYRSGIFPMADSRDDPDIFWVEPRSRAILPLNGFHLSRSLARTLRRERFAITCNRAFSQVMEACAAPRTRTADRHGADGDDDDTSWISHRIQASYEGLHRLGHAHSIECWQAGDDSRPALVGGLYGVGFDRVFCGESMFSCAADASKVALACLVAALRRCGAELLDCQFLTGHLASLGAVEMPQVQYLSLLRAAQRPYADGEEPLALPDGFAALLAGASSSTGASSPGKLIAQDLTQTS